MRQIFIISTQYCIIIVTTSQSGIFKMKTISDIYNIFGKVYVSLIQL